MPSRAGKNRLSQVPPFRICSDSWRLRNHWEWKVPCKEVCLAWNTNNKEIMLLTTRTNKKTMANLRRYWKRSRLKNKNWRPWQETPSCKKKLKMSFWRPN
mmetsp:Transcript_38076/g.109493  ORF Transcript_38076/g.109493 Transcript_38076/m.109493 type:complete len:100 (+) Transcript_38076:197-496(+)